MRLQHMIIIIHVWSKLFFISNYYIHIKRGMYTALLYSVDIEFDWLCILYCASRTDCIALYVDRTASLQTCGHNEF